MRLSKLQRQLERIYELRVEHDVDDFVITDPALARLLDNGPSARDVPEKLLVRQQGECVDIALYLDPEVVERLKRNDPTENLHGGNLADFWTALEGVSHFLYLTWNVGHRRGVPLMELEMQAEVDKYVTAAMLLGSQEGGRVPSELHAILFDDPVFDAALDEKGLAVYRDANYYAARYCSGLHQRFLGARKDGAMINDLRRFYRLTRHDKINHIRSAR